MHRGSRRYLRAIVAAAIAVGSAVVVAADDDATTLRCDQLKTLAVPTADQPTAAQREALAGCDSDELYYATGDARDDQKARACAYLERGKDDSLHFGGAGTLMMIYANGRGVPRNIELASKFSCELDAAPAEIEGRLRHLQEIGAKSPGAEEFDVCDDITSGYMMGECARHGEAAESVRREARAATLVAGWADAHKAELQRLRTAAEAYFDASVDGEVDMGGTARGAMAIGHRSLLETAYAEALARFERGDFPSGSSGSLNKADAELNATYARAIKLAGPARTDGMFGNLGTVNSDGIRTTERAWIKYRDAWVEFGRKKYPTVPADAWREWATRERTAVLKELMGENVEG